MENPKKRLNIISKTATECYVNVYEIWLELLHVDGKIYVQETHNETDNEDIQEKNKS